MSRNLEKLRERRLNLLLIFPHQLYWPHPVLESASAHGEIDHIALVEHDLFFGDSRYPCQFHKQKLWLHRSSMAHYLSRLRDQNWNANIIEYAAERSSCDAIREWVGNLVGEGDRQTFLHAVDPVDGILRRRCEKLRLGDTQWTWWESPNFLNTTQDNQEYRSGKKRWFMADFYKWQRRRLNLLMAGDQPRGGQWSFDRDNRRRVPKELHGRLPQLPQASPDASDELARQWVEQRFADHPGSLETLYLPTTHEAAASWLGDFVRQRLCQFGDYEDAILRGESFLWHSVLTPLLNIGLLSPQQVLDAVLGFSQRNDVPLNSLEGFVRQVVGWREFMRATYVDLGVTMRTTNAWQHRRTLSPRFYDGTTGILPVDDAIQRVIRTGYCHHIERLMVLGGFMFLCEIDPDDIYRWFMEMFVDSYDWVMVPNVYAMSQNADGGLITTKPYFSGSAYIRKMSNYPTGKTVAQRVATGDTWWDVWDGLYWRWIDNHRQQLAKNPRWAMMCKSAEKMDPAKMAGHHATAGRYLDWLG